MKKVLFVCLGNICRSTMAQSVFQNLVNEAGLERDFLIDSAGTSDEEEGNPPHPGTQQKLAEKHIPLVPHASRPIQESELDKWDLIVYMDSQNEAHLKHIFGHLNSEKFKPLLSFAPASYKRIIGGRKDVADPWWTHDFQKTYEDVVAGCEGLLRNLS